jgi:hypothetical protein
VILKVSNSCHGIVYEYKEAAARVVAIAARRPTGLLLAGW